MEAELASLRRENKRLRAQLNRAADGLTNPWDVLEISKDADPTSIQAAFRRLSKQHHPDRVGGDRQKFEALVKARDQMLSARFT